MFSSSCVNAHQDLTTFEFDEIVENTKIRISQEQNLIGTLFNYFGRHT